MDVVGTPVAVCLWVSVCVSRGVWAFLMVQWPLKLLSTLLLMLLLFA